MKKSYTFKIGGPAGFGILSTGLIFSKTVSRSGYHLFDYFEYPSLIRGGHNVTETHFAKTPVFSQEEGVDVLVSLNKETYELHKKEMKTGAVVIYDPDSFEIPKDATYKKDYILAPVPFTSLLSKIGGLKLMENNVALGAVCALFKIDPAILFSAIKEEFLNKGEKIIAKNQEAAKVGYDWINDKKIVLKSFIETMTDSSKIFKKAVLTGNEAVGLGAIAGGCKFYSAYPMTPSSAILHTLAKYAQKVGMVVRHPEDEIAAISEAVGASFAGVRSMVGTSGGGFSLMIESVSLAGMTERGIVIIIGQRPGPATGMPTWTEQGDLLFTIRSGHGEFPKIVLAPGDIAETFKLTIKALNLADIYQTPVIVLTDKFTGESHQNLSIADFDNLNIPIENGKWENDSKPEKEKINSFHRYKTMTDGISPRILPGTKGFYFQENSYEHLEDGHTSELSEERIKQVNKRNKKLATYLSSHFEAPKLYGKTEADITLIGWGSVKGPILEALLNREDEINNKKVNFLHFTHLWPLDREEMKRELGKHKRLVLIENNSTAQLAQLLEGQTGVEIKEKFLKYDGRPFYPKEITDLINKL